MDLIIAARVAGREGRTWNNWTFSDEVQEAIETCADLDTGAIEASFAQGAREHRIANGWRTLWTTAPVDYDGFGTETIQAVGEYFGKPLRSILVDPQYGTYQADRNASGLHPTWDEDPRIADAKAQEERERRTAEDAKRQAAHAAGLVWLQTASDEDLEDFDTFEAHGLRFTDVKEEKEQRIADAKEKACLAEWERCSAVLAEGITLIDDGELSKRGQFGVIPGRAPHVYYNIKIVRSWPDEADRANVIGEGGDNCGSVSYVANWLMSGRLRIALIDEVPPYAVLKRIGHEHVKAIRRTVVEGRAVWVGRPTFGETLVLDERGHLVRSKKILAALNG